MQSADASRMKQLIANIKNISAQTTRLRVGTVKISEKMKNLAPYQKAQTRPVFWLEYAFRALDAVNSTASKELSKAILTNMRTRVDWAYGIGSLIAGPHQESEALFHGAVHSLPMWPASVPAINKAEDEDFLALLGKTCETLAGEVKVTTGSVPCLFGLFFPVQRERMENASKVKLDKVTTTLLGLAEQTSYTALPCDKRVGAARGARVVFLDGEFFQVMPTTPEFQLSAPKQAKEGAEAVPGDEIPEHYVQDIAILRKRGEVGTQPDIVEARNKRIHHRILNAAGVLVEDSQDVTLSSGHNLLLPLSKKDIASIIDFLVQFGKIMINGDYKIPTLKVAATVPVLLCGPPQEGSTRSEKHFANIAQTFDVSENVARGAAQNSHVAAPTLLSLMTTPGNAAAVQAAMYQASKSYGCKWIEILALRMIGYNFTPLLVVRTAIQMFPSAPWSLFFTREEFGLNDDISLIELNIHPPYGTWISFIKEMANRGIVSKEKSADWSTLTEEEQRDILQHCHKTILTQKKDAPGLRTQGEAYLTDYERWLKDPLIMYTGVEGMSSQYPDLVFMAVQLIRQHLPGSQIGGYKGGSISRCKSPQFIKEVVERYSSYLSCVTSSLVTADLQVGPLLVELLTAPEALSPHEVEALRGAIKGDATEIGAAAIAEAMTPGASE
uniref:Uncharacterized protein n=1 Tax=Schistocephalus solidus TaxID=70667 RepID=A0A0X3PBP9_SCHSO